MFKFPPPPTWATYIPGRRGRADFSTHSNVGHAKNAISGTGHGQIYQWVDNEWVLMWDIKSATDIPWRKK